MYLSLQIYLWLGEFSNVIERSRGGEVAAHIAQTKDLGYIGANNVITINDGKKSIHQEKFWTLLGASEKDASKIEGKVYFSIGWENDHLILPA